MHEVSLGQTIQDYLTGDELEMTTYEDLRQGLARMLVEEKGYPKEKVIPKVEIKYDVDDKPFSRNVDLLVYDDQGKPVLALLFCSGTPESYTREAVYAGRLVPEGPTSLVVVTDSKDARLLRTMDGKVLDSGFAAIPSWDALQKLLRDNPAPKLDPARVLREQRVFYMYSGFLESCCGKTCPEP
ncbi:Type I restriction enzyme R protein N terminus (HSDR_N) [Desulfonatronum thiosulfatophilum]|uniref:Type I restriction enzyme R protein N terminus (HSDR_N) n=1 Tax=Desulfonatronum thiosulfatophilum TaxID=617002 RepID=A0A1G6CZ20_9BACT|nr:type I restriction enzyme HsdR N-terminal domain-containing protein [Desulfonatronum thiosulfatophilum]SDB38163.1 Type I restriction enzyme R protein N terminus (HSDR_N) [Desulfonatronum thiosulfatophilum]